MQTAFDIELGTLFDVLLNDFGEAIEKDDSMPLSLFLLLTRRLVFPRVTGCELHVRHCVAVRHVSNFGVITQITYENYLVNASTRHVVPPVSAGLFIIRQAG